MEAIRLHAGELLVEDVPASRIADAFGTPTYVYSSRSIREAYERFTGAFRGVRHRVCYAVKANSNLGVLSLLADLGASFDIVSGGELQRVLAAGADASRIVFSGVGKQTGEMRDALRAGIACFNVESASELTRLNAVAGELGAVAPISFRVNPDVDARTHPYISTGLKENKFGVSVADARALYREAAHLAHVSIAGIDCHIGSQITELDPFLEATTLILDMVDELQAEGITLRHIDLGGGLGVRYRDEADVDIEDFAAAIIQCVGRREHELWFEPGRYIVANAGLLLTRVVALKNNEDKHFAIVDAAMNDLLRPALYEAWQAVSAVKPREAGDARTWDIVGPVCESSDFLARGRRMVLEEGDLLAVHSAGAYGFVMSSNYNSRNRAAEVMVAGDAYHCTRERETIADQLRLEHPFRPA